MSEEHKDKIEILIRDVKSEEDSKVYTDFYGFINKKNPKVCVVSS